MPTDQMTEPDKLEDASTPTRVAPWMVVLALLVTIIFVGLWLASRGSSSDESSSLSAPSTSAVVGDDDEPGDSDGGTDGDTGADARIGNYLDGETRFSTFAEALAAAGFSEQLEGDGPFTVFAPADDSIEADVLSAVVRSPDTAERTLQFHIVEGTFTAEELTAIRSLETLAGEQLRVFPLADGGGVLLHNGVVLTESIERPNGVIHVIGSLLVPSDIQLGDDATTTTAPTGDDGEAVDDDETTTTTSEASSTTTTGPAATGDLAELATLEPIQFADSSAVIASSSTGTLDRVAEILAANPDARIEIGGHTDNVGPIAGNQRLSERRANAVRDYLIEAGIVADQLTAVGYGPDQPIESNDTPEGRAANRRIEFAVI